MNIKKTNIDFKAKNISSKWWLPIIKLAIDKIWLQGWIKTFFWKYELNEDGKRWPKTKSWITKMIYQLVYCNILWLKNPTEMNRVKKDPCFLANSIKLASQPTFSRMFTSVNEDHIVSMNELNKSLIANDLKDRVRKNWWKKLKSIKLWTDSTKTQTYWKQEWAGFIYHYWVVWYHPDLSTETDRKLVINWILRIWKTYSSKWTEMQLDDVLELYSKYVENIIFKADSAYWKPEIIELLRKYWANYYIKAKSYKARRFNCSVEFDGKRYWIKELPKKYFIEEDEDWKEKLVKRYIEIKHKAKWRKQSEKITIKIEYQEEIDENALLEKTRIVIQMLINWWNEKWEKAFKEYAERGKEEKIIEELKNWCFVKTLSHKTMIQNHFDFLLKIFAYNVMQIIRLNTLKWTKYENCKPNTFRDIAVNIGWKVAKLWREFFLHLSESFHYKKWAIIILEKIPNITFSLC